MKTNTPLKGPQINNMGSTRLYDVVGKVFLHLDGIHTTTNKNYSWLGSADQYATLKRRAKAAGKDFPYHPLPRSLFDINRLQESTISQASESSNNKNSI